MYVCMHVCIYLYTHMRPQTHTCLHARMETHAQAYGHKSSFLSSTCPEIFMSTCNSRAETPITTSPPKPPAVCHAHMHTYIHASSCLPCIILYFTFYINSLSCPSLSVCVCIFANSLKEILEGILCLRSRRDPRSHPSQNLEAFSGSKSICPRLLTSSSRSVLVCVHVHIFMHVFAHTLYIYIYIFIFFYVCKYIQIQSHSYTRRCILSM
jgi:hypothetical protein